jgi:hypothetical protein
VVVAGWCLWRCSWRRRWADGDGRCVIHYPS